ncbi:MAG: hypothetical protein Tsb0032_36910 [Kiloniellaceae bacterium]
MTQTYSSIPETDPGKPVEADTDGIEAEIRSTRKSIGDNLDRIQQKLSPGDVIDNVVDYARTNGGAVAGSVSRTVRENPVPVAMIGAGILWLALSSRNRHADAEETDGETLSARAGAAAQKVRGKAGEVGEEVRHKAGALSRKARSQAVRAKDSGGRFVKDHPLLVGAAGLALGAAAAAALPRTRREDRSFGEHSDRLKQAVRTAAEEKGREVQSAAAAAIKKAKQEAAKKTSTASGNGGGKKAPKASAS